MRGFRFISLIVSTTIIAGVFGCSGTMKGFVRQGCEPVEFQFSEDGFGGGKLSATTPDGETYTGELNFHHSTAYGFGSGYTYGAYNAFGLTSTYSTSTIITTTYSELVDAKLGGSEGHLMECQFIMKYPDSGLISGGNGLCKTSSGYVIDIMYIGTPKSKLGKNELIINSNGSIRVLDEGTIFYIPTGTIWNGEANYHVEKTNPEGKAYTETVRKYWKVKITGFVRQETIR